MDQMKREQLEAAGIDVAGALERFMNNENLLERMLKKFLTDANYQKLLEAAEKQDAQQGLEASHTLKGLCGNLSMTALASLFTRQVELFRSDDSQGAFAMLPEISEAYRQVTDCISSL